MKASKLFLLKPHQYVVVLLALFLFAGCQRNLAPVKPHVSDTVIKSILPEVEMQVAETIVVPDEKPLSMDTLLYSIHARISSIITNNFYFDKRVRLKSNKFYALNNYQTKWLGLHAPTSLYYALMVAIKNCGKYGLHPEDYPVYSMDEQLQSFYCGEKSEVEIYDMDAQLTDAFFLFTTHLIEGRIKYTNN